MPDIYSDIKLERDYQLQKWGTVADDCVNRPNDWVSYISHHSTRWFKGGFEPYDKETVDEFRTQMIKVAAIAVAAVESLDRQREWRGIPFYQKKDEVND